VSRHRCVDSIPLLANNTKFASVIELKYFAQYSWVHRLAQAKPDPNVISTRRGTFRTDCYPAYRIESRSPSSRIQPEHGAIIPENRGKVHSSAMGANRALHLSVSFHLTKRLLQGCPPGRCEQ
jgi:hypothetical protein